jgi:hypothetical protein
MQGVKKLDATSPTVTLESVLITPTIDAFEGRDMVIKDIPPSVSDDIHG